MWEVSSYGDGRVQGLLSRHYCREESKRTRPYYRPGYSLVLHTQDEHGGEAVFIWWRPKWECGLPQARRFDGLQAIECTIFRNETKFLSSDLIKAAVDIVQHWKHARSTPIPDGLITSVNSAKTAKRRGRGHSPGHCFLMAGWRGFAHLPTRNTDIWLQFGGRMDESDDVNRWMSDRRTMGFSNRGVGEKQRAEFRVMPGQRFGKLTVVSYATLHPRPDKKGATPVWRCRCDCSGFSETRQDYLRTGQAKSCGHCIEKTTIPALEPWLLREIALALEFEGSLGVYAITPKISLGVRDCTMQLAKDLHERVRLGHFYPRKTVSWDVVGFEAIELAKQLVPYMVTKKAQAELVASYPFGVRSEHVTDAMRAERERQIALTKVLNRRGPREPDPEWAVREAEWREAIAAMPDEQRCRLLALVVEFEGTIGVYQHHSADSRGELRHSVHLSVPQVDHRRALLGVSQALGRGLGVISAPKIDKRPGYSAMRQWIVHPAEDVVSLASEVLPFLSYKRPRAQLVIEFPRASWSERCRLALESKRLCLKEVAARGDEGEAPGDEPNV